MALILYLNGGFRTGFAVSCSSPALLCLSNFVLSATAASAAARIRSKAQDTPLTTTNLTRAYWIYLAAGALIAAGFADFALIGFHFQKAERRAGKFDSGVLRSRDGKRARSHRFR